MLHDRSDRRLQGPVQTRSRIITYYANVWTVIIAVVLALGVLYVLYRMQQERRGDTTALNEARRALVEQSDELTDLLRSVDTLNQDLRRAVSELDPNRATPKGRPGSGSSESPAARPDQRVSAGLSYESANSIFTDLTSETPSAAALLVFVDEVLALHTIGVSRTLASDACHQAWLHIGPAAAREERQSFARRVYKSVRPSIIDPQEAWSEQRNEERPLPPSLAHQLAL